MQRPGLDSVVVASPRPIPRTTEPPTDVSSAPETRQPPSLPDPEQLPLGMFEGIPLVPVEMHGPDDEVVVVPVREPPTCGEWSYEDEELEEPRFSARRVDGVEAPTSKATPIHPIRAIPAPRGAAEPLAPGPAGTSGSAAADAADAQAALALAVAAPPPRATRPTVDALRAAFEQTPQDTPRALAFVAALERRNDADTALKVIDRAMEAGADAFLLTCARASALGAKLRYDDAEKAIKAAAKLRPDAPEVLLQVGMLACRRGRWRDAVEPLQKALQLAPESAAVHYWAGEALNHTDRLPAALAAYERAAELEPDHWRAIKGVGMVLDRLGRSGEAAPFYRRARDAQRA
jgi:Flp pilus assembly protein TadD